MKPYEHPRFGRPEANESVQIWSYPDGIVTWSVNRLDLPSRRVVPGPASEFQLPCSHQSCRMLYVAAELAEAFTPDLLHAAAVEWEQRSLPLDSGSVG